MTRTIALCLCLTLGGVTAKAAQGDKKDSGIPDGLKALRHTDPNVRYKAADLLVRLGSVGKFAIPALRELLNDKDARVRVKAAEALWHVERPPARTLLPVLTASLKDKDPGVRINALVVLGDMGSGAKSAVPLIGQALRDKEQDVRLEAVLTLGEIGPPAKALVLDLFATLTDDELRLLEPAVAVTLGNIGTAALPALTNALTHKDAARRRTAAYALSLIGAKADEAMPALIKALTDSDPDVRSRAARTLGKVGSKAKDALPKLQAAVKDKDASVRISAALAVAQVSGGEDSVAILAGALQDAKEYVREQAAAALRELGPKASAAAPALVKALADKEPRVRATAAETLGKLPPTGATTGKLDALLADPDEEVRLSAALARWASSEEKGREKLLEVVARGLGSNRAAVRKRAAVVLGEFGKGAQAAVPALLTVLRDPDASVRQAVAAALRSIDPAAAARAGVR
ncbi:MAG: HEAT repeat domain-containing protein [Gemmataceae bacterium]|nr:HEAT repeat domain-containing protein [Gemmataceae bacterium]